MKIVGGSWLLSFEDDESLREGAIAIDGDTILATGPLSQLQKQFPKAQCEAFDEALLLPGLINAHLHLDRSGFFERFTIETEAHCSPIQWLLEGLKYLTRTPATTVTQSMQKNIDALLENGVTGIGAMLHYEGGFPLIQATPIRGVVFQEILSGPDKRAQQRFEVALALLEQYAEENPEKLRMGLGPYSAYLLSKNLLNIIAHQSRDNQIPLQMHVAEHFAEMEFFFESKGEIATQLFPAIGWEELPVPHRKTPMNHLEDIGFLNTPLSMVGGYQMSAADFPRLKNKNISMIYCPSANRRFKFGTFPLKQLLEQNIPVALGSELFSHRHGFDLWEEMRLALKEGSNPLPTPAQLLKMATWGGAKALQFEKTIGSLKPGKKADYILVKKPSTPADDLDSLCRELILQTESSSILRVAINGEIVKGH